MCRGSPQDQPRDDPTDTTNKPNNKPNRMKNGQKLNRKPNDKKEPIEPVDIRKRKSKEVEKDGFEDGPIKTKKVTSKRTKPSPKDLPRSSRLTLSSNLLSMGSSQMLSSMSTFSAATPQVLI